MAGAGGEQLRRSGMRARRLDGASTSAAALARESDRALLLCEQCGELRRGGDPCLERRPAVGRERAVGERCQLDDVPIVELLIAGAVHRHATPKGIAERGRAVPSRKAGLRTISMARRALTPPRTPLRPKYSRPRGCDRRREYAAGSRCL